MKLVIRADDYGYTSIFNQGTIKAIEEGLVTYVDLMLDCAGCEDAIARIKAYPWISVGWHGGHFWGWPVSDPKKVPSLLGNDGRFKFKDDPQEKNRVVYEEALLECEAQVVRCIRLLGRAPCVTTLGESVFESARKEICDKYGIVYHYMKKKSRHHDGWETLDPKYEDLDIYMPIQHESVYQILYADKAEDRQKYDPVSWFIEDPDHMQEHKVAIAAFHPGYLDDFIYFDSSKHFNLARLMDIEALSSDRLKAWVRDNRIELVNMTDALYGTNEYQAHLKASGKDYALD